MKLGVKVVLDPSFAQRTRAELGEFVNQVMTDVYAFAKQHTPVRSGKAKSRWKKEGSGAGTQVVNNVPYIGRLEDGYSKQAPAGIVEPTKTDIKRKYRRL